MPDIKRIPLSASIPSDPWLDSEDETASDLLQHLQSDNLALSRLRDALVADGEQVGSANAFS
ncbi:hypothetical protein [Aureimonas phyllosphaerae]|uniref:Uncharacterized protein n=1 Tax=Aureimonas phyllosphaerae TaxID=1166078 RepID=A0A7W6FT05_9HYPH|nr:hypothetical protein [Aureimonas phyllosphaerae]MBB3934694.1 hypothetical protein [Aureimonas phyllosphaerae]MBB3958090.1 hypothetical protein [Aureimonas phyllosphaerae]SFE91636.1 hypothetical protein SAMN05216566_10161 [Aureimonas phyllosphaerae]